MKFSTRLLRLGRTLMSVSLLCAVPGVVFAQSDQGSFARAGSWDFMLHPQYLEGTEVKFEGGSKADIENDWGFGFGMNYNYSQRLALGFDFSWNDSNYTATRILDNPQNEEVKVGGTLQSTVLAFNANYYFTDGKLAPFVAGTLGWTFLDSNIPSGPSESVCWWDPWYGYICGSYTPTKSTDEFGYGIGAGLRWDVTRSFFVRGSVMEYWVSVEKATDDVTATTARIDFGFSLR